MTKDEMKNKISMALKDPTLQQGFEIICKENAELSEQLLVVSEQLRLAKEMPYSAVKKFAEEKTQEQLNKAKELLKWFVWYFREGSLHHVPYKHKVNEAEQFLKEE